MHLNIIKHKHTHIYREGSTGVSEKKKRRMIMSAERCHIERKKSIAPRSGPMIPESHCETGSFTDFVW